MKWNSSPMTGQSTHSLSQRLSVIIPFAEGETHLMALLRDLKPLDGAEIIVSAVTRNSMNAKVHWHLSASLGRAHQMNEAASLSSRDFLWFLHADSRVNDETIDRLLKAVDRKPTAIHYSNLQFSDGPPWMAVNALGAWFRSHVMGLPFGDQGLCLHRALFEKLGRFPNVPYAEDFHFIRKSKGLGVELCCTGGTVHTSSRKYQTGGWLSTTLSHLKQTFWSLPLERKKWVK